MKAWNVPVILVRTLLKYKSMHLFIIVKLITKQGLRLLHGTLGLNHNTSKGGCRKSYVITPKIDGLQQCYSLNMKCPS